MKYFILLASVAVSGCDILGIGKACTDISVPGINVSVEDSATSGSVVSEGVWVRAVDGEFVDSARFPMSNPQPSATVSLAYERPGTYAVTVTANGYLTWIQENVEVSQDDCHVRTTDLRARLRQFSE